MNRVKKYLFLLLTMLFVCTQHDLQVRADTSAQQADILFLHDTHSHLESFRTIRDGEDVQAGGFSRIKTLIDEQREKNPDTFIFDGGDFAMGTLVQTVFESEAAELRMLGHIGCDVTTLGNHEFDYRSAGLVQMLDTALQSADLTPSIVLCNVDWEAMEDKGLTQEQQMLRDVFDTYGITDYTIVEKGDLRIAVLGVFGKDALACAPTCVLEFKDASEAAKETVKEIQASEDVDMIVCVSHSGTDSKESKSEDEILAKAVPEIDLIISGHTHTSLEKPIRHGDTNIVSCGEYGKDMGALSMIRKEDGRWEVKRYELIPIDERTDRDEETDQKINAFMENVDQSYLSDFGYTCDLVLAENEVDFTPLEEISTIHEEHNLGSIIADAYQYAVENSEFFDGDPVTAAVVPSGTIRDTYTSGDITVEDVFNSFSLGIGEDGVPGYPLISVYLTGRELKTAAEIDASVSDYMTTARLYASGLYFTFNPHRMILNKVTDCYLMDEMNQRTEIEDDRLYRIICDLYSGQMLGAVTDKSFGLLSVVPKYKDGTPITDYADVIIAEEGKELKAWDAIARYMNSFEDTDGDGIGNVPLLYAEKQGRKVVDTSLNPWELIKNPNRFSIIIAGIVVLFLVIIVILLIHWRNRKTKKQF